MTDVTSPPRPAVVAARAVFDLRPVIYVLGVMTCGAGGLMLIPAWMDVSTGARPDAFVVSAALAIGLGGLMVLTNRGAGPLTTLRQTYVLTFTTWLIIPTVSAVPFVFSEVHLTFTDAFFEAMSGITTTGSTVIIGLDDLPPSVLLWRALLQWVGGLGFVVMAIAILPLLRTGGMQLFRTESSDRSEKPLARVSTIALGMVSTYLALTLACAIAYEYAGMTVFDAVTHAMTTLATGGYANHDASFAFFEQPAIHWIAIVFMLAGSLPFMLYLQAARGDASIFRDRQVLWLLTGVLAAGLVLALWLASRLDMPIDDAFRLSFFNVVSIMSTTGYASAGYDAWGDFAGILFFYLMFVGGCTGSTAGGIKIFRFQVLYVVLTSYTKHRFLPHLVTNRTYGARPLTSDAVEGVLAFLAVYFATVAVIAIALAFLDLDWYTALSGSVQAVGNIGPGLGPEIGPAGNFAGLPDGAKWILSLGMLAGRLELFTVLVILTPSFWK